jgi:hypothetical protein
MTAKSYSLLAAAIFTIVAVLQLARATMAWEVTVGTATVPVWPSWIAFAVAGTLALVGFSAARN